MKFKLSALSIAALGLLVVGAVGYCAANFWRGDDHQMPHTYRDAQGITITFNPYDHRRSALGNAFLTDPGEPPRQLDYQDDHKFHLLILSPAAAIAAPSGDARWEGIKAFLQVHSNYQLTPNDESFVLDSDRFERVHD